MERDLSLAPCLSSKADHLALYFFKWFPTPNKAFFGDYELKVQNYESNLRRFFFIISIFIQGGQAVRLWIEIFITWDLLLKISY